MTCTACGKKNPAEARFCLACGAELAPAALREERKVVTVVFADLATREAETLLPAAS
jgi:hypothetical protein